MFLKHDKLEYFLVANKFSSEQSYSEKIDSQLRYISGLIRESMLTSLSPIIYTHDTLGLGLGSLLKQFFGSDRLTWIHDTHENIQGYSSSSTAGRTSLDGEKLQLMSNMYYSSIVPDLHICVSNVIRTAIQSDSITSNPLTIYNLPFTLNSNSSTPSSNLSIKKKLGLNHDDKLMVYVGNVNSARGIELAIEATQQCPDWHFAVLARSCAYLNQLTQFVREKELTHKVHFLDYVPFWQLPDFLSDADVGYRGSLILFKLTLALQQKYLSILLPDFQYLAPRQIFFQN